MHKAKQTIHQAIFSYHYGEFMPIYVDGKCANTGEFIIYKVKRAIKTRSLL